MNITIIKFKDWIREAVRDDLHPSECRCGRGLGNLIGYGRNLTFIPHCPHCGSGWTMGKKSASQVVKHSDGTIILSAGIVCRKCGLEFDEYGALQICQAPPSRNAMKELEKRHKAERLVREATGASVDALKEHIEKLKKEKGV